MIMGRDRLALAGIAAGALALAVLGLVTVGGPQTARAERRDALRFEDLNALAQYIDCVSAQGGAGLPQAPLPVLSACAEDPPVTDDFDGKPYLYERLSASSYRICARFEIPGNLRAQDFWSGKGDFAPSTGCLTVWADE